MTDLRLDTPLTIDQIDFRIQSINKGGYATILAYKDARVDMERLDAVYGVGFWQRKHDIIGGNLYCSVGVYVTPLGQFVWVQDVGNSSFTEAKKGEASDSFKRACFNLGIGRELYDYPVIQVKLKDDEFTLDGNKAKQTWKLKLKEWRWKCYFVGKKVGYLEAVDEKGAGRFLWYSLEGLQPSIDAMKHGFESDDLFLAAEAWYELKEGQQAAMWVAESKGGPFTQEEKKIIQSSEFRELKPTGGDNGTEN